MDISQWKEKPIFSTNATYLCQRPSSNRYIIHVQHIHLTFMCVFTLCERVTLAEHNIANGQYAVPSLSPFDESNIKPKVQSQVQPIVHERLG